MDEQLQNYKSAIEALLFVSEKPVLIEQLKEVFSELSSSQIHDLIMQLQEEYVNRAAGMVVVEIAGGFQMLSNSGAAPYIREFYKTRTKEKLSRPALESLAIIAYKQPVGRADVEVIRGVNSDGTIAHLLNKGLIKITGRKEVPGRPFLYATTREFLEYFGLKSLDDLPKIEEFNQLGVDAPDMAIDGNAQNETAGDPSGVITSNCECPVRGPSEAKQSFEAENVAVGQTQEQTATQESSGQSRTMNVENTAVYLTKIRESAQPNQ